MNWLIRIPILDRAPAFRRCFKFVAPLLVSGLLVGLPAKVWAVGDDPGNPTGVSGSYNGEVTTAGSYDPFTGNAKRMVMDLAVPGSAGTYPLVFTRIFNSRLDSVSGDYSYFGDGVNWRHSYQWALASDLDEDGNVCYRIAYPDGRVVNFCQYRTYKPSTETYFRGPVGTQDRFEHVSNLQMYLHLSDGGIIAFKKASQDNPGSPIFYGRAFSITDPYGAVTLLKYDNNPLYFSQVVEPGGRTLSFQYGSTNNQVVLLSVTDNNGRVVTYGYATKGTHTSTGVANTPFTVLGFALYNYEPLTIAGYYVSSAYTYDLSIVDGTTPVLLTCFDPHYPGAMVSIRYAYSGFTGLQNPVTGFVFEEQHPTDANTGLMVSRLAQSSGRDALIRTETRGDGPSRALRYGEANNSIGTTNAKRSQLTSSTDYQNNTTSLTYYDLADKDTYGRGNIKDSRNALGHTTTYRTDPITGKVTGVTLPDNRTRSYQYIGLGSEIGHYYLYQSTDERNRTTTYQREPSGVIKQIDYPDGGSISITYYILNGGSANPNGFRVPAKMINPLGGTTDYSYDEPADPQGTSHGGSGRKGLLTSFKRTYFENADGTGAQHVDTTQFYYDGFDRVKQITDNRGVSDKYLYNERNQVIRITHTMDNTSVAYTYDDLGQLKSVTDELNHTATTDYDEYRRVIRVKTPVNSSQNTFQSRSFVYDHRDNNGAAAGSAYTRTSATWGVTWTNSAKAVWRVFTPNEWVSDMYSGYYAASTPDTVVAVAGDGAVRESYTYDALGQVLKSLDAQGQPWQNTYDNCQRLASSWDPLEAYNTGNHITTFNYFGASQNDETGVLSAGLAKSVISPQPDLAYVPVTNKATNHDPMGRVLEAKDPRSVAFQSSFNKAGNLSVQSDGGQNAGGHTNRYQYDQLGRPAGVTYPVDNTREAWTYDASGNLSTYKNRAGATKTMVYDLRNRLKSASWNDGSVPTYTYNYDDASRLMLVQSMDVDNTFTYDDSGQMLSESAQLSGLSKQTTHYDRDVDGNIYAIQYPSGGYPSYSYDDQQRCKGSTSFSRLRYTKNWLSARVIYPSSIPEESPYKAILTTYNHQLNGRVYELRHTKINENLRGVSNIRDHFYGYAPDGRLSWCNRQADGSPDSSGSDLEDNRGDAFYYRADGSLSSVWRDVFVNGNAWPGRGSATADSRVQETTIDPTSGLPTTYLNTYAYDDAGNRSQVSQMGSNTINYTADGGNRYTSFAYDDNSNTTNAGVGWIYAYDAENRMTSAKPPNGVRKMFFTYDGLGRLIKEVVDNQVRIYYYAGAQRIEERDTTNTLIYRYVFDTPGSDSIVVREGNGGPLWYLADTMGNTTHLVDDAGDVVEAYLYDAYGTPSVYDATGTPRFPNATDYDNRYLWHGASAYLWQAGAGLYYCRARFYLPQHGRFLQPDPIGQAGGLNIYSYCGNDPINGDDPWGLEGEDGGRIVVTADYLPGGGGSTSGAASGALFGNSEPSETVDLGTIVGRMRSSQPSPTPLPPRQASPALIPIGDPNLMTKTLQTMQQSHGEAFKFTQKGAEGLAWHLTITVATGAVGEFLAPVVNGLRATGTIGRAGTALNQTYRLGLSSNRAAVLQANRRLYNIFTSRGGRIILQRSESLFGKTGQIYGNYNYARNTITLYRSSNLSTISEELLHYAQAERLGNMGAGAVQLSSALEAELEAEAAIILQQWGYIELF